MPRYQFPAPKIPSIGPILAKKESGPAPDSYISALETHFPNILDTIQTMWGYKELNLYFHKLTIDERGDREGFPPAVWDEIHTLASLHRQVVPEVTTFSTIYDTPSRAHRLHA